MRIESEPVPGRFTFEPQVHRTTRRHRVLGYPGLTRPMLDYMVETIRDFCKRT